jgi:AraC-like DNA-binding protein
VHDSLFGPHVEFERDFNGIVCARSDLEVRTPVADPEIARLARQMLDSVVADTPRDMATQVRELVFTQLGGGSCAIKRTAQQLGVDPRTVQRHLAREGQTFGGIVESVRRELAGRYVNERHRPLAAVSSLLGFSAPSGFSRWYVRQFGVTPSVSRARVSPGARPRACPRCR